MWGLGSTDDTETGSKATISLFEKERSQERKKEISYKRKKGSKKVVVKEERNRESKLKETNKESRER